MKTPTILIRGKITPTIKIKGKTNASIIKIYPELEKTEVTPTVEDQVLKPEAYGFEEVLVKGVQSYIDEDIKPEYIKEGVDILGVVGNYKGVDSSDATAMVEDILAGKTAYVNNEKIEGTIQQYNGDFSGNGTTRNEWEEIAKSLISIGENGEDITKLPSGLTSIKTEAFKSMSNLALTELPDSVTEIGNGAFYGCTSMILDKLPPNITEINPSVFYNCRKLRVTKLPENLTSVGESAFYYCLDMAVTKLPKSLTYIYQNAFNSCGKLAIKEIPEGITKLENNIFRGCSGLTELTIKGNVTVFGQYSLYGCSNLQKLIIPNITKVPSLQSLNAFTNTPIRNGTGYIYVPDNLIEEIKVATNWNGLASQIKSISELEV